MSDQAFRVNEFDAQDEVLFAIKKPKKAGETWIYVEPTTWMWTLFGPAHPATVALADKATRAALKRRTEQREAMEAGHKWAPPVETPEMIQRENVDNIVARLKGFTPIDFGDGPVTFTPDLARSILLDRRKGWILKQVMGWLGAEENFIQPSADS